MGAEQAAEHIQLIGLVNDVSLRGLIPPELAKGVPGPAIVRALERMRGDYVFVRETLTFEGEAPPP